MKDLSEAGQGLGARKTDWSELWLGRDSAQ